MAANQNVRKSINKHIFIDRHGGFIYGEFLMTAIAVTVILVKYFNFYWAAGIVLFVILWLSMDYMFFKFRLFRWILSTVWSVFYACIAYYVAFAVSPIDRQINAYIFATFAFILAIYLHRREYIFERSATVTLFDYYG